MPAPAVAYEPYKLDPALYSRQRQRDFRRGLVVWIFATAAMFCIVGSLAAGYPKPILFTASAMLLVTCAALCASSMRRVLGRSQASYSSYSLFIYPDRFVHTQDDTPSLTIRNNEITSIQEIARKGIMVKTAFAPRFLWVPSELVGYEHVKRELASRKPFDDSARYLPFLDLVQLFIQRNQPPRPPAAIR